MSKESNMWKKEVLTIIHNLFEKNIDYENYFRIDDGEDISNTEIQIFLDTIIDRDYVSVDSKFTDKDYFDYLKLFEEKVREFVSKIDLSNVSDDILLSSNFYDIHEHYTDGSELYYSCGLHIVKE